MRAWIFAALLAGCGGRVASSESATDASTPEDSTEDVEFSIDTAPPEPVPFDAPVPEPARDATPLDGGACLDRPSGCTADDPIKPLVRKCIAVEWACDRAYIDVDAQGCATSLDYEHGVYAPKFVACLKAALEAQRFPCLAGKHVMTFIDSCTVK